MFTGIVEETGKVVSAQSGGLRIKADKALGGMESGGSVAVNGVCLTVTEFSDESFSAAVMPETLKRTNLGSLAAGDKVNLECALTLQKGIGGHLVQGHIDGTGRVSAVVPEGEAVLITIKAPSLVMRYIVEKGFIAVDGVSLTVVGCDAASFTVSIVGYTREHTTIEDRRAGDEVNLEADIIAKYVERLSQPRTSGITVEFLKEHGFPVA